MRAFLIGSFLVGEVIIIYATFIMGEDKTLTRSEMPTIFEGENNADKIQILLPESYNEINIRDCTVTFNWLQTGTENEGKNNGNIKVLTFEEDLYNDRYLQSILPITITETANVGQIEIYLVLTKPDNTLLMKTNMSTMEIKRHKEITDYVPDEQISLLGDYLIRMQQMQNTCDIALQQVSATSTILLQLAQDMETKIRNFEQKLEDWERTHLI